MWLRGVLRRLCLTRRLRQQLSAVATRECQQKRNFAAVASLTLFTFQLGAAVACECASLGCLRHHNPRQIDKLDASPSARASLLANALAHAVAPDLNLPGRVRASRRPHSHHMNAKTDARIPALTVKCRSDARLRSCLPLPGRDIAQRAPPVCERSIGARCRNPMPRGTGKASS